MAEAFDIRVSAIDEERFGIRTARATGITLAQIPEVLAFCQSNAIRLLIGRTLVTELKAAQAMERLGFELMDTLIYYIRDLQKFPVPAHEGEILVRPFRTGEEQQVEAVATESFRGYFGHYHADDRLDPEQCDEVYRSWAARSLMPSNLVSEVIVAELNSQVVGFNTLVLNSPEEAEIRLVGVAPQFQRQGIARALMIGAMNWCLAQGAQRLLISTQITNYAQQKVWVRVGFEPLYAFYTFHKWFD